jgi:hypothetical protein
MEDVSPFVNHFARLVWLLAHHPEDHDSQKEELRRCLMMASSQAQVLPLREIGLALSTNQHLEDQATADVRELVMRMGAHSVRKLDFDAVVPAKDVMDVARAIAAEPEHGDEGAAFDAAMIRFNLTGITAFLGSSGFVRHPTPGLLPAFAGPLRTPTIGLGTRFDDVEPSPRAKPEVVKRSGESQAIMQIQLMRGGGRNETVAELVARLDQVLQLPNAAGLVDDISRVTEDLGVQGRWVEFVQVLERMHHHHERLHDGDTKRAFLVGIRRLQRPVLLQEVAKLLPGHREIREACTRILSAAGETGADVLIENLIVSEVSGERRAYLDALKQCPAAANSLLHLLNDERWYVVRNATWLLGELGTVEADRRLTELMSHREPRVRRAVATALGRLATTRSILALLQSLNDSSPDVRVQAVQAIASAKNPRAVPWLIEALDSEQDADVQAALVSALSASPTEDAVARLVRAAEAGGMLVRKPAAVRLRAIEALAEAGTPSARQALEDLLSDRDREVRSAVEQAVLRLSA